jgi:hypothetical protein
VLRRGLIKRVGDGASTNIWRDRWLPNHFGGWPLTPEGGQTAEWVSELLSENGQWNEDFIRQCFIPVDAAAILRMPARIQYEDMWAWEPEKNGVYSVRSAYRLLDTACIRETNVQDASTSGSNVWKMVWKLKVPPKIKVF